ncbi:hypothetical protein COOONC_20924 [Cooperia oncophora]
MGSRTSLRRNADKSEPGIDGSATDFDESIDSYSLAPSPKRKSSRLNVLFGVDHLDVRTVIEKLKYIDSGSPVYAAVETEGMCSSEESKPLTQQLFVP